MIEKTEMTLNYPRQIIKMALVTPGNYVLTLITDASMCV